MNARASATAAPALEFSAAALLLGTLPVGRDGGASATGRGRCRFWWLSFAIGLDTPTRQVSVDAVMTLRRGSAKLHRIDDHVLTGGDAAKSILRSLLQRDKVGA